MRQNRIMEAVYGHQIAAGKSHDYAKAFALKHHEGEVFARHFAVLRERRAAAKRAVDAEAMVPRKPKDFVVSRTLGEGSYSTVFMAREKSTGRDFAMKILDKNHIKKENKVKYVKTEKDVFNACNHPLIVRLFYTMQDAQKLYFVIEYCQNGELLDWIRKLGSFDEECARFYVGEIVLALEHMHAKGIIHRDLKPENILMSAEMHVKVTDFGTSKFLVQEEDDGRANSFVGTAQYVSPELLTDKVACKASDLWALGCILYQLLSGKPPFRGGNAHQTFQLIKALDYEFPPMFPEKGADLVRQLLVLNPAARLGADETGGYAALKAHPFFEGLDWDTLTQQQPPKLEAYLPAMSAEDKNIHETDAADEVLAGIEAAALLREAGVEPTTVPRKGDTEREKLLREQRETSPWQKFMGKEELIVKEGLVDKRRGLFAKRRMLLLTDKPRLVYIDAETMTVKGEIPWSSELHPQYRNMKTFFVHTPKRTYYLDDVERAALTWVDTIQQVVRMQRGK